MRHGLGKGGKSMIKNTLNINKIINNITKLLIILSFLILLYSLYRLSIKISETNFFLFLNSLALFLGLLSGRFLIKSNSDKIKYKNDIELLFILTFLFMFLSLIESFNSIYYRTINYFIFIIISFILISIQIFLLKDKKFIYIILFEMSLLSYINRNPIIIINNFLPIWDTFFHYTVIREILNYGEVMNYLWVNFPLFHVLNGMIIQTIFGYDTIYYFLIDNIIISLYPLITYITVNNFLNNKKAALYSALATLSLTWLAQPHVTPHYFSILLNLYSLSLIFSSYFSKNRYRKGIITLMILSFAAFMYHPSAGLALTYSFISLTGILLFFKKRYHVFPIVYATMIISYVIYYTASYFDYFIRHLTIPSNPLNPEFVSQPYFSLAGLQYYTLSHLNYFSLIYLAGISMYFAFKNPDLKKTAPVLILIAVIVHPVVALFTGIGVEQVVGTAFILLIISLIAGISFTINNRKILAFLMIPLLTISFFSGLLLSDDNPYFGKYGTLYYPLLFSPASGDQVKSFFDKIPSNEFVTGTHFTISHIYYFYTFLKEAEFRNATSYNTPDENIHGYIIISKYEIIRQGLGELKPDQAILFLRKMQENENILYSTEDSWVFYNIEI